MAKWQKNLAIFAAGCLLTGGVTIGVGALTGGVQDIKDIYMAPVPAPKETKEEYDNVSSLDLDISNTIAKVEVADVDKVTVIRTIDNEKIFDYTGKLEASVTNGVLKIKNEADLSRDEKPHVDTNILGVFSYFRKIEHRWTVPIVIQLPKDLVIEDVNIQLRGGAWLDIIGTEIKNLMFQGNYGTDITLNNAIIHQVDAETEGQLNIHTSYLKKGKMAVQSYLNAQASKLEYLNIEFTGGMVDLTETILKDSHIHAASDFFNLSGVTYLGKVDIENKNGTISMEQLSNMDLLSLDLAAEPGSITIDVNDLPYTEIMDEKKSIYQHKGNQVRSEVTIKVQHGDINLKDWAEDDRHRPEWMRDNAPDFKRFE